jgi:AcrR family transcriptional regulator
MPRPKQTEEQIAAMRARILDAAAELLSDEGPEALSIRAIADRVGVSHMVLYTYFQNRDALMAALSERQRDHMRERHADMLRRAETGDLREVLREVLASYAHMAHRYPRLYQFAWVQPIDAGNLNDRPHPLEAHLQHLSDLIDLGIERRLCGDRDPLLAAATAFSIVNGPLFLYHCGRMSDEAWCHQLEQEALGVAMRYLCSDLSHDEHT